MASSSDRPGRAPGGVVATEPRRHLVQRQPGDDLALTWATPLLDAGRSDGAPVEQERARAIFEDLVRANPTVLHHRNYLTIALINVGDVLRDLGRLAEARDSYARAVALNDVPGQPRSTGLFFQSLLMFSLERLALANGLAGDRAGATADARRAVTLFEGLASRSNDEWLHTACAGRRSGPGRPGQDGRAGRGGRPCPMAALRRAVAMGYRDSREFRREPTPLDLLRGREDFRLLMMDLESPADAFAGGR